LDAKLIISWKRSGADLAVKWLMPAGAPRDKDEDLIGTGPFWAVIEQNIYKLSPSAARIASLFPYASQISLTRSQIGPLLEVVASESYSSQFLEIHNSNLQPAAEIHPPKIVLEVNLREDAQEHFGTSSGVNLIAQLAFEYPSPPPDSNSVYLPDRDKEREAVELLYSLGFDYDRERKRYQISGGAALDLVHSAPKTFPAAWDVRGFTSLKKKIRRADLTVNISLASAVDQTRSGAGKARETEEKIDWFDCHVSLSLNNANVPISTLFKSSQAEMGGWVKLENGSYARVPSGSLQQLKTTLGLLDPNFKLSNTLRSRLSMAQALGLSKLDDQLVNVTVDKSLKALARRLEDFQGVQKVKLSKNFSGNLRPYQHEGLSWLSFLYDFELGGILADEMGLGKTVQTLALVNTLKDRLARQGRKLKPVLVVAPTSVITNWCYEAHRFTPKLKVLLLHGAARKRLFSDAADYDLVVTSYALLRLDRYELERIPFSIAVLDEAQQIKNYQAATTAAAKALRAERRLALSGTPTENRPMELWSIMDFLMPGYLGTNEFFRNYIEKPILEGGPGVEVAKFLRNKTRPFILRRTKAEVEKDLPPKIESVLYTSMTDSQRDLYSHILAEVKPRVFDAVERKGIAAASVSILAALLRLRQVCNHPNSIDALKNIEGYDSGKFNLLQDILDEALESGRKILLFCQFKEMLAIIRRHVEARRISYLYLDGATRQRQQLVDRFNSDSSVKLFLISLKAGGLGLNLAAADTVIIYDPWWNPAVESQAVDRAHRIGQRRTVTVYRLVTADSVEQKIMQLKRKKSAIVDALINKNAISTLTLTKGELEALFEAPPVELSSEGGG
ncbi:MAG: hypothetical protein DCC75_07415, partial [Proteobacteria bacterium]